MLAANLGKPVYMIFSVTQIMITIQYIQIMVNHECLPKELDENSD